MPDIRTELVRVGDTTTEARIRTHRVLIDRPEDKGGNDQGAMGGELMLASLGGCFASTLIAALQSRNLDVDDLAITVTGTLEGTPQRFTSAVLDVSGHGIERDRFARVITVAERSCIVANTLKHSLKLDVRLSDASTMANS